MSYETKNIRNVAFMGHGGTGKTTLVENMLYLTGAIDRQGKTADGNTVCDYDAEEIKRGITISTGIAPVDFGGCKINVLDCPGFFDFVGEVFCAMRAAEVGVIFLSAKDGISVGAERSWKYLKNADMPAMFYVSKLDEEHADFDAVVDAFGAWTPEELPKHSTSLAHLCDILAGTDVRLLVVGGAGSLFVDPEHTTTLNQTPDFPEAFQPLAAAMQKALNELRQVQGVKWTYVSPAADFQADGEKCGAYRLGGEELMVGSQGPIISYADYAIAMVDLAESGEHVGERVSVVRP